jgi:hypothetical protein
LLEEAVMFQVSPTGPKIPLRRPFTTLAAPDFNARIEELIWGIHYHGGQVMAQYTLADGKVLAFTFDGDPYKGMPVEQIDAALAWEASEFALEQGWEDDDDSDNEF